MGDAVRVVAHELPVPRQHRKTAAGLHQHAPHAQHAPGTVECDLDVAVGTHHAAIELNQRLAKLAHPLEQLLTGNEVALEALNGGARQWNWRDGYELSDPLHHVVA